MFNPQSALNVLEMGCQKALEKSPEADRIAALLAAFEVEGRVVKRQ